MQKYHNKKTLKLMGLSKPETWLGKAIGVYEPNDHRDDVNSLLKLAAIISVIFFLIAVFGG